jgi:hypothetical protein
VQGKAVVARFDGGRLSSEGGLLALREIERRLGLADRQRVKQTSRRWVVGAVVLLRRPSGSPVTLYRQPETLILTVWLKNIHRDFTTPLNSRLN